MRRKITYALLALALLATLSTARYKTIKIGETLTYTRISILGVRFVAQHSPSGDRYAITTDAGGWDDNGLFFCPSPWNQFPYETKSPYRFLIPLWDYIPKADC